MLADGLQIQEGAFRRVALFLDDHLDPCQLGFVGQHVDKSRVGNGHEVLVVDPANVHGLFPALGVSDDQDAEPFAHHPVHDGPAGPMQIVIDLAVAFVCQGGETMRGVLPFGQAGLQVSTTFVVVRIDAFQRSAVNQKRNDTFLV